MTGTEEEYVEIIYENEDVTVEASELDGYIYVTDKTATDKQYLIHMSKLVEIAQREEER